jgi:hypothetical protein
MSNRKSTMVELVTELLKRNDKGQFDTLIKNARAGWYHDYKNPDHIPCGKMQFVEDSANFPELADLRQQVTDGEFDEEADEEDKAELRTYVPESMWSMFGL